MKKFILLILLSIMLIGCGKVEKFYLDDEFYSQGVITEMDVSKLEEFEKDERSFVVFVYLPGCTSCAAFRTVLDEFIVDNKIEIYSMSILDAKGTSIDDNVEFAPALVLYNKGEVVDFLDSTSDEDKPALTSVAGLKKWLEEYIYLSK